MALLKDFGEIDEYNLYHYETYKNIVETLYGITLFQIVEEDLTNDSITLRCFEKSFWSKKQKAYLRLEHIEDLQPNTQDFRYSDGYGLPPYSDILIGLDFWCEYESIYSSKLFRRFNLGRSRKEILSLGMLLNHIQVNLNAYNQVSLDTLNNSSSWINEEVASTLNISDSLANVYWIPLQKLQVFEKYKKISNQPTQFVNEQ